MRLLIRPQVRVFSVWIYYLRSVPTRPWHCGGNDGSLVVEPRSNGLAGSKIRSLGPVHGITVTTTIILNLRNFFSFLCCSNFNLKRKRNLILWLILWRGYYIFLNYSRIPRRFYEIFYSIIRGNFYYDRTCSNILK